MITIPDDVLAVMNRCLLDLSQFVHRTDKLSYQAVAEKISQSAVAGLAIQRASVWQLNPDLDVMHCVALYVDNTFVDIAEVPILCERDFPAYFKALQEERFIVAHDARTDSDTCEFTETYLKPLDIFSMLDLPIRQDGKVVGILCCEHTGSIREWGLLSQNYAGMLADIAERALTEIAIKQLALFDSLTLLANRSKLLKDIRETEPTALIIFDIASFTSINDVYGEKNGDLVLKHVANCLVQHTQHNGTLYRYGHDQFALLVALPIDSLQLQAWALSVSEACEDVPCVIDDIVIPFSFVFSMSCEPKENLIVTANLALKELKKSNMDYLCYDKRLGLEAVIASNISWTKKIKLAIESKKIISFISPLLIIEHSK